MNYIVKDDNPDVAFTITGGEQADAEGNVIPGTSTFEVVSTDSNVLAVAVNADGKSGTVHFGAPGLASVNVTEKDASGAVIASGGDSFTVTLGDPASITPISVSFEGLTGTP